MNILMLGDVVGSAGRQIVRKLLPMLRVEHKIDLCIANGENAASGLGLDANCARDLFAAGVDGLTLGNHTWAKRSFINDIDSFENICRPLNAPSVWPGRDHLLFQTEVGPVLILNLLGRVFMDPVADPFTLGKQAALHFKKEYKCKMIIIDFHAEATAEKQALAWYLLDEVSAVVGTHTHVPTADERILGSGMAYQSDLGMCGPSAGVLGMSRSCALRRFVDSLPAAYEAETGPCCLQGSIIELCPRTGQARSIKRLAYAEEQQ